MFHSSAICRVHPSQHPALFDAKRYGPGPLGGCKLRPRRACEELEIEETIYRELALGGTRSYYEETQSLLDGLLSGSGTSSLRSSRLCPVRRRLVTKHKGWDRWYETQDLLTFWARYYCLSILDKHHHPDINYEQGIKILRMCTDELKRRLPIDFKGVRLDSQFAYVLPPVTRLTCHQMLVKVIDEKGIREVEYDDSKPVASA